MAEQMYSTEEAAKILGLQVRTVRNYVREGRLPGVRIGKQYRIARADLEVFTTGIAGGDATASAGVGERRRVEAPRAVETAVEVSSVVQVDGVGQAAMERLERTLTAIAVAGAGDATELRVEPLYDEQRQRLRVIIVGPVPETAELLRVIDLFARERGGVE